jgi:lipoyl synthase
VAIDAALPELFEQHRGAQVRGPHRWEHFWDSTVAAVEIFGSDKVGVHLIVGLGETEREMIEAIQRAQDLGAQTHLFSFFPEAGTALRSWAQPSYGHYRRVQLARYIINDKYGRADQMTFNAAGQVVDFGVEYLDEVVDEGTAFMTSGCPGEDGVVACNRPFGNERPSRPFRNYPFLPDVEDIALIRLQLQQDLRG